MLKSSTGTRTALDVLNIIAGLGLFLTPWLLGYAAETYAAWNAWVIGGAVALMAAAALIAFYQAEEWVNLALGVWTMIAPWVLGFSAVSAAVTAHVASGLIITVIAAGSLWFINQRPLTA